MQDQDYDQSQPMDVEPDYNEQNPYGEQQIQNPYNQGDEQNFYGDEQNPYGQQQSQVPDMIMRATSQYQNTQYDRSNLQKVIKKQVDQIDDLIYLGKEWSTIYYYLCGWNRKLVEEYFDVDKTHKKMLNYREGNNMKFQNLGDGDCDICGEPGLILKNLCGDAFCINCWSGHIQYRMKDYSDPLPPCINQQCKIRVSHLLIEQICKKDKKFEMVFQGTICRSYAQLSKTVKVCWGPDCTNCFFIKKPFDVTQCKQCKNFVCLFCGRQHHVPAQCHDLPSWRRVTEDSTSFVSDFDYKICPKCKQAVERRSGCNSMVCRCKNQFCYICGENWVPNHQAHGTCYRQKEIRQLQAQKKKRNQNQKEYYDKMKQAKAEEDRLKNIQQKTQKLDLQQLKSKLVKSCKIFESDLYFMYQYIKVCRLGILFQKYGHIGTFLTPNLLLKTTVVNLKDPCEKLDFFFFSFLPELLKTVDEPHLVIYKKTEEEKARLQKMREYPIQVFNQEKKNAAVAVSAIEKFLELDKKQ